MKKHYQILSPDPAAVQTLSRSLKCHPAVAAVLVNRHISTPEAAAGFLNGELKNLRPPSAIKDMDRAVARILRALEKEETILIFGDYDVDGITATTLLYDFLRKVGARVTYYIPHRTKEGYGLTGDHIHRIAVPRGIGLIVTVDCGSSSHGAVDAARAAGIDVVVTDHHHVALPLPAAEAVVNPNRPDCSAGFGMLAGVGVVYALLICLRKHLRENGFWASRPEPNLKVLCDLVALGTVADIVPLRRENRLFTQTGLAVMGTENRTGINALRQAAGVSDKAPTAEDIAFRLAPRLNAAGRIAHAACAVRLLTTQDAPRARRIAGLLNRLNEKRRFTEQEILTQALSYIHANPVVLQRNAIVLKHPNWHEGVLGIVAAKLVERFYRPTILISLKNGTGKGSARSIPGFHLFRGLEKSSEYLEQFGGHSMAAGLRIRADRIDGFRDAFETVVAEDTRPEDFTPVLRIDRTLTFDEITPMLLDGLAALEPFGQDNPEPVFMARNIAVVFSKIVGSRHRRLRLRDPRSAAGGVLEAIHFNIDPAAAAPKFLKQIVFRLRWNHWKGSKTIQLFIEGL